MTDAAAYAPPRDLVSKITRRWRQAQMARPAVLRFAQPILSISFDDFPHSAAELGAAILERHGARGTFYAAAGLAGQEGPCGRNFNAVDLHALAAAGHEIGCHTYAHHDCARSDMQDTLADLDRNRDHLTALGFRGPLRALAYPYGEASTDLKKALPPRYHSARGIKPGLSRGRVDLAHLRAYPLYGDTLNQAHAALRRAVRSKAWMIAYTHDVAEAPSPYGVTPRALDQFVAAARAAGVAILPVSQALEKALP